jgi:hypothetical protein
MPGKEARQFGQQLQAEYHLEENELYPKQDQLKTGPGSLVRLPLGIHLKSGQQYTFITPDGRPLAPTIRDQVQLLTQPKRIPEVFLSDVLERAAHDQGHKKVESIGVSRRPILG